MKKSSAKAFLFKVAKGLAYAPIILFALTAVFFDILASFARAFANRMDVATRWVSTPFVKAYEWIEDHE